MLKRKRGNDNWENEAGWERNSVVIASLELCEERWERVDIAEICTQSVSDIGSWEEEGNYE